MQLTWLLMGTLLLGCSEDFTNKTDGGDDASPSLDAGPPIEGGIGMDAQPDAPMPRPTHRLFVGNSDASSPGIVAWDDADIISQDRMPDVTITDGQVKGKIISMELAGSRLFAFNDASGTMYAFNDAGKLNGSSTASFGLGSNAFQGMPTLHLQRIIHSPPFLITQDSTTSAIQVFKNPMTLTSSDIAYVRLGSINEPWGAAAYDPQNDRLFGGELPQHVIKYLKGVNAGQPSLADFSGASLNVLCMAIDNVRLYAVGMDQSGQVEVAIYNLSSVHPGSAPDALVTKNLPSMGLPFDCALANDTLVISYTANGKGSVGVYTNAKSLGNQSDVRQLTTDNLEGVRIRLSPKTGLLYVAGSHRGTPSVTVWNNITTTPTLQAKLTSGLANPASLAIYEP